MTSATPTESTELLDRLAIQELSARYALGMDGGRRELFESAWTEDAAFRCGELGLDCHGIAAILDYYDRGPGKAAPAPTDGSAVRLAGNLVLTFDGDTATGISEFIAMRRSDLTYFAYTIGVYEDTYRRGDDGWRIASRTMIVAPTRKSA
jgi:hypothetical protein